VYTVVSACRGGRWGIGRPVETHQGLRIVPSQPGRTPRRPSRCRGVRLWNRKPAS